MKSMLVSLVYMSHNHDYEDANIVKKEKERAKQEMQSAKDQRAKLYEQLRQEFN